MADPKRKPKKRESDEPARMTRLVESDESPVDMLRARLAEAEANPALVGDVCFAVRRLAEAVGDTDERHDLQRFSLPPGKEGVLIDLRRKAEEAETTHDPDVIQDLFVALNAFLGEELREEPGDEGIGGSILQDGNPVSGGQVAEEKIGNEMGAAPPEETPVGREPEMPVKPQGEPGGDEELGSRQAAAEADGFARYAAGPATPPNGGEINPPAEKPGNTTKATQCEACGYEPMPSPSGGTMEKEKQKESAAPATAETALATKLADATAEIDLLKSKLMEAERKPEATTVQMSETDRADLFQLRAEKELATKTAKAMTAIREAGLDGIVEPSALTTFSEPQWALMLETIAGSATTRSYGQPVVTTEAPEREPRKQPMRESAVSFFKNSYDNAADGLGL